MHKLRFKQIVFIKNMDSIKTIKRLSVVGACVFLTFLIPVCNSGNEYKTTQNDAPKKNNDDYDGVYSGVKFIGDGYRYKSCEGTFRNLTGKKIKNLGVQISFFDDNSKLQISNDSINELDAGEDWRFKFNFVDKTANAFRIDSFTGSYGGNRYSDLNVISEERYLEKKKYKKPTDEELAAQHKEWERQTALQKNELKLTENQNHTNKIESQKPSKNQKLLEAKYRGVRLRAESGSVEAMFELSELLRNGIGCEKNIDESNQWFNKFNQKKQLEPK